MPKLQPDLLFSSDWSNNNRHLLVTAFISQSKSVNGISRYLQNLPNSSIPYLFLKNQLLPTGIKSTWLNKSGRCSQKQSQSQQCLNSQCIAHNNPCFISKGFDFADEDPWKIIVLINRMDFLCYGFPSSWHSQLNLPLCSNDSPNMAIPIIKWNSPGQIVTPPSLRA